MPAQLTKKRVIGMDLDDVLVDLMEKLGAFHNDRYGTSLTYDQFHSLNLDEVFGCTRVEMDERIAEFHSSDDHDLALPIEGAYEAILDLSKSYIIHIVTARSSEMRFRSEQVLDRLFPGLFTGLHFTNYYRNKHGTALKKSDICREIGAIAFVDDAHHNAVDIASIGCRVFLLDKPWNRLPIPTGVSRVHSWQEIVGLIHQI